MIKRPVFVFLLLAVCVAHRLPHFKRAEKKAHFRKGSDYTVGYFDQILNHTDTNSITFKQRYYVVDKYWTKPNGPIILSIAGEAPQESPDGIDDALELLAERVGAVVLTPEHRFFGESMPFNDLSVANLKYLTVEQEIEDLIYFLKYYQNTINALYGKTTRNKVLVSGGSYAGMISSFTRQLYPDIVDAAWSSSGVVDAVYNFTEFDTQIAVSMGPTCAQASRLAQQMVDDMLKTEKNAYVKKLFNASSMSNDDFLWMLSDAQTLIIQYSNKAQFCDTMVKGMEDDRLVEAFADVCNNVFYPKYCGPAGPYLYSDDVMRNTSLTSDGVSQRAWWWMVCSQVAYAQNYPGEMGIRSPAITLDFHKKKCDNVYGPGIWPPNTAAFNAKYGAKKPRTTNVYYTNGSQDPWQWACVTVSPNPTTLPAHVMTGDDVGHCVDLHKPKTTDPIDVTRTRNDIIEWAAKILK